MKSSPIHTRKSELGVALLISIFVLLLVCVVAIALIVSSGTESALSGNYRSATAVYYAALAGLEETRGRLLPTNPNYYNDPSFMPTASGVLAVNQVRYVIHPLPGEVVAPWNTTDPTTYPDTEYASEFPSPDYTMPAGPPNLRTVTSVSKVANIEGPLFKWVRITAATEWSLGIDVNGSGGTLDKNTPVYYDGTQNRLTLAPSGSQVLALTALAVLPNGSSKMLQYIVTSTKTLSFGAAITLAGTSTGPSNVIFDYPTAGPFYVDGRDYLCTVTPHPPNNPISPNPPAIGLGWTDNQPPSWGSNGSTPPPPANYLGAPPSPPSMRNVNATLSSDFQTGTGVQNLITQYTNDPSVTKVAGGATSLPATSQAIPGKILVTGDLDLTGSSSTGYGLLIVTGNFSYSSGTSWNGVVMVLGNGWAREVSGGAGGGQFNGAVVLANVSGANLGPTYIDFNNPSGSSFYYSTCWIDYALPPPGYKVLSFHEITQ